MSKEREKYILERLLKEKKVTVSELAAALYTSEPSIRRDLQRLEKQNLLRRIHGGAVLEEHSASLQRIPFVIREMEHAGAKSFMAQKAARLVEDGNTVFLDASSSACAMVPFLAGKANLTVITSGVKTLIQLGEYGIRAFSTGGKLLASCLSLVEEDACRTVAGFNADLVFFSCRGLSPEGYVTDFSMEENAVRREMIRHARRAFLLCDSEKFNKTYLHNLCRMEEIDGVISEVDFSRELLYRA